MRAPAHPFLQSNFRVPAKNLIDGDPPVVAFPEHMEGERCPTECEIEAGKATHPALLLQAKCLTLFEKRHEGTPQEGRKRGDAPRGCEEVHID